MNRFKLFSATFVFATIVIITSIVFATKLKTILYPLGTYEKEWARVDSLKNKGLTNSALERVNQIHDKAIAEKNDVQILKSILNRISLKGMVEEDAIFKNIAELQAEVNTLNAPAKNIAQAVLADLLWNYYQDNRYEILQRSITSEKTTGDIHFWDVQKFSRACKELYLASLSDKNKLKEIKITDYNQILKGDKETDIKRPTLYDFLANKAIDFFMNDEPEISSALNQFSTNDKIYFSTEAQFANANIVDTDSSYKFLAVKLFQDLTKEHLFKTSEPLFDVNLRRLKFALRTSNLEEKDSLYIESLTTTINNYKSNPAIAAYIFELATWYNSKQTKMFYTIKKH